MIEFDYIKSSHKLSIKCDDSEVFSNIREHFSVHNKNATFVQRKFGRNVKIPSRKYVITPTGKVDLGLYWEIRRFLIEEQVVSPVSITESLKNALKIGNTHDIHTDFALELRDYQLDTLKLAIKHGWGVCILGTGAGKTLVTASLIENYYRNSKNKDTFKCLMIVPDLGLVNQTYDEFLTYGVSFKLTKWTGSIEPDLTSNVIICNRGILQSRFDKSDWVKYVDLLVADEVHSIKAQNSISKIVSTIKTPHRYGFTGTLPQEKLDKWFIIGKFGPVLYEKSSFELREEKYLANVEVKMLNLDYGQLRIPKLSDNKYYNEIIYLHDQKKRNSVIEGLATRLPNNTLILVNRIVHGEILFEQLSVGAPSGKQVFFIRGDVEVDERDRVKKLMEENSNIVCIAISAIFSTGINIKNLNNIIFAAGGKAFIRTVQSIGRGLRLHENKQKLVIFDLCDQLHYGILHSDQRKLIYDKEKINFSETHIKMY